MEKVRFIANRFSEISLQIPPKTFQHIGLLSPQKSCSTNSLSYEDIAKRQRVPARQTIIIDHSISTLSSVVYFTEEARTDTARKLRVPDEFHRLFR
jgi:hypothetical protein